MRGGTTVSSDAGLAVGGTEAGRRGCWTRPPPARTPATLRTRACCKACAAAPDASSSRATPRPDLLERVNLHNTAPSLTAVAPDPPVHRAVFTHPLTGLGSLSRTVFERELNKWS